MCLNPGLFPELWQFVESATSHVLSNYATGRHDAAPGVHKSKIGRPARRANVTEISIHSEPSSGAQSGDRRTHARLTNVQGRREF